MITVSTKSALVVAVAGLLTLPSIGWAQSTDFSGTWSFDAARSNGKPEPVSLAGGEAPEVTAEGRIGGGRGRGGRGAPAANGQAAGGRAARAVDAFKLVIKQTPAAITLLDGGVSLAFTLDGAEESISALGRAGYPKGKAAWEGDKLVLSTRQDVYVGHAQFDTRTTKDVYSLDGGTLTIDKTETFQGKTTNTKLVYSKATS